MQEQKTRAAKGRAARQEAVEFNVPSFGSQSGGRGGNRGGEPRQEKKVIIMFKMKIFIIFKFLLLSCNFKCILSLFSFEKIPTPERYF